MQARMKATTALNANVRQVEVHLSRRLPEVCCDVVDEAMNRNLSDTMPGD